MEGVEDWFQKWPWPTIPPLAVPLICKHRSLVTQMVENLPAIQVQPLGHEDTLEKGMATHSSILAQRIS